MTPQETAVLETTASQEELSTWEKISQKIGVFGKISTMVFDWVVKRIPLTAVEAAIVHPDGSRILLTWRDDEHFQGWHLPGSFVFFRNSWRTTCERILKKEGSPEAKIHNIELVTCFNFHTLKQDPRGHATSVLILVFLDPNSPLPEENDKKRFFKEMPGDILQVKLSKEVAADETIPTPFCSSHEVLFKTAMATLIARPDLLADEYQQKFC